MPSLYQQIAGLKKSIEDKLGLPPKPKKPLTPYFRFMAQIRPNLTQKNPQAKATGRTSFIIVEMKVLIVSFMLLFYECFVFTTDIVKLTAQEWEKVDTTVREQLEADYKREMVDFVAAQVKYDQMLTNEQREEIKKAKIDIAESKEKRKLKKVMCVCVCVCVCVQG
jgi:transcription factor A